MTEDSEVLQRRNALAGLGCVLIVVLGVWLRSLSGGFVYDDNLLIKRNPALTDLSHLPDVLSDGMWSFVDAEEAQFVGYWRPLTGTLLLLTNVLGHGSSVAFHAVVIALHLLATAAAFALAHRLSKSVPVALLTALLFGVHPVHVESVAWISALNDPLFALFSFAALWVWIGWREEGSRGQPWLAGGLLFLALLSKETGLCVVLLAALFDLVRASRTRTHERQPVFPGGVRAWMPFALAIAVWYVARIAVFHDPLAGLSRTTTWFGVGTARMAQLRLELVGGFTWLCLWPIELKLFHPFRPALPVTDPEFLRALACVAALVAAIWYAWRRTLRTLAFALCFLPVSLAPSLGRVELLGISPLAERYLYLGVFGFVLALTWSAWRFLPRIPATITCIAIAALYSARTIDRTGVWRDEFTLLRASVAESPTVPQGYWGLGRVLLERYRATNSAEDLREAKRVLLQGADLLARAQQGDASIFATDGDHLQIDLGIAWCLLYESEASKEYDDGAAYRAFETLAAKHPGSAQVQVGLAVAALQAGRLTDAESALRKALVQNERNVEAHHNLGIVLLRRGDFAGAQRCFERALQLRPNHLDDQLWMARIAVQRGKEPEARSWLGKARAAHPTSTAPLVIEATLAAQRSQIAEAFALVNRALEQDPNDGEAYALKAKLHLAKGEKDAAAQALTRACELLPTNFEAHYNLGALRLEHSTEHALRYLVRAYALRPANETGALLRKTLTQLTFGDAGAPCELASADLARGDLDSAAEWIAKALAIDPQSSTAHLLLERLHLRRREVDAGR